MKTMLKTNYAESTKVVFYSNKTGSSFHKACIFKNHHWSFFIGTTYFSHFIGSRYCCYCNKKNHQVDVKQRRYHDSIIRRYWNRPFKTI